MSFVGETLVTARSFAEYEAMFALSREDLTGRILDCPAGAADFVREVNSRGGRAVACDAVYAGRSTEELAVLAREETDRGNAYVRDHADDYVWSFFANPDDHQDSRRESVRGFAADLSRRPEHYVPGKLPSLPFTDSAFDLVVSSHLLFSYTDRLDHDFHVDAITELLRVAGREVRIFPLVPMGSTEIYKGMDSLRDHLSALGVDTNIAPVDYEFQRNADHMLTCTHTPRSITLSGDAPSR